MPSEKRRTLNISKKFIHMDTIIKNCKDKNISVSDYLCSLAERDYLQQKDPTSTFPTIDRLYDFMLNKTKDVGDYLFDLFISRKISAKELSNIIIANKALSIQFQNNHLIQAFLDKLEREKPSINIDSKRQATNEFVLNESTGFIEEQLNGINLSDIEQLKQQELEKQMLREKAEHEFQEWNKKYNGKYPRNFMYDFKPEEYEDKLQEWNDSMLTEQEFNNIVDEEEKKEEEKKEEEIEIESAPFSNWILTDEEISELLVDRQVIEQLA